MIKHYYFKKTRDLNSFKLFLSIILNKNVIIKKSFRSLCIGKMQFTLISYVPRLVIKLGEIHFINLPNIDVFIAVNHQNLLIIFIQSQKVVRPARVIAYHVVCHVMVRSQIQKFLAGTENKIFMIHEGLWR